MRVVDSKGTTRSKCTNTRYAWIHGVLVCSVSRPIVSLSVFLKKNSLHLLEVPVCLLHLLLFCFASSLQDHFSVALPRDIITEQRSKSKGRMSCRSGFPF